MLSRWSAAAREVRHPAFFVELAWDSSVGDHSDAQGGSGGTTQPGKETGPGDLSSMARAAEPFIHGHGGALEALGEELQFRGAAPGSARAAEASDSPARQDLLSRALLGLLAFYKKWISPLLPRACRFEPTCSEYARLAIIKYGPLKGTMKAMGRVLRCHPFHPGGIDRP